MTEALNFILSLGSMDPEKAFSVLFSILLTVSPILLCIFLIMIFIPLWVNYVRAKFFFKEKYCVLEMKLPKETVKSPLAMELFLMSLHQTSGESTWFDKYWLGKTRTWFSLEIVSIEGHVKFFIWMRASWKTLVSASMYSQYPGIEIHEVEDYTRSVHWDKKEVSIWGGELKYTKSVAYPLKTYVDYGLDKDPKEEFKVDPLVPMIEALGTLGPNQQIWIQYIVRAHKPEQIKPGSWFKTTDAWKDAVMAEVNKLMVRDPKTKATGELTEAGHVRPFLSPGEQETLKALERRLEKQGFDTGIRVAYICKPEAFSPHNIGLILGSFKQFGSESLNGLKPNGSKWLMKFDYPWQDYRDIRKNRQSKKLLEAMKRRSYFFPPYDSTPLILNSEELATIYHFPGQVAQTPTLPRIPSKKVEAPSNLPL